MKTVQEIEREVEALPPAEVPRLARWIAEYEAELWDKQIDEDAAAGKLDFLWDEARKDIAEGKARPISELLDDK